MADAITLDLLARLCQRTLQGMGALRKDVADVRTLSLQTIGFVRRLERRMGEQRDDLGLLIKAELSGALGNMQPQLDHQLRPIRDKLFGLDKLEQRVSALESGI